MSEYRVYRKWDKAILDKHKKVMNLPKGYHKIKVHLVFAVKFDGRHKARLVEDGLLVPEPIENIYSGVVSMTKDYVIRFRIHQPNYSFLPDHDFDWTYSVYGDIHDILPDDMPESLDKAVVTTTTMDANLNHFLATGKSLTGHFVNITPVDLYSKKQATVETL